MWWFCESCIHACSILPSAGAYSFAAVRCYFQIGLLTFFLPICALLQQPQDAVDNSMLYSSAAAAAGVDDSITVYDGADAYAAYAYQSEASVDSGGLLPSEIFHFSDETTDKAARVMVRFCLL